MADVALRLGPYIPGRTRPSYSALEQWRNVEAQCISFLNVSLRWLLAHSTAGDGWCGPCCLSLCVGCCLVCVRFCWCSVVLRLCCLAGAVSSVALRVFCLAGAFSSGCAPPLSCPPARLVLWCLLVHLLGLCCFLPPILAVFPDALSQASYCRYCPETKTLGKHLNSSAGYFPTWRSVTVHRLRNCFPVAAAGRLLHKVLLTQHVVTGLFSSSTWYGIHVYPVMNLVSGGFPFLSCLM